MIGTILLIALLVAGASFVYLYCDKTREEGKITRSMIETIKKELNKIEGHVGGAKRARAYNRKRISKLENKVKKKVVKKPKKKVAKKKK